MRTVHRNQATLEAQEASTREAIPITVYKLADGRYEVLRGFDEERGGEAVARFREGRQEF